MLLIGLILFRGKGDFYRLGHGNDLHNREPKLVEALDGKQIVDVAVGALHCLAVTDEGEVSEKKINFIQSIICNF